LFLWTPVNYGAGIALLLAEIGRNRSATFTLFCTHAGALVRSDRGLPGRLIGGDIRGCLVVALSSTEAARWWPLSSQLQNLSVLGEHLLKLFQPCRINIGCDLQRVSTRRRVLSVFKSFVLI
jgi:hypothetical protein